MWRTVVFLPLLSLLAACSAAGPGGYGYAVNERPSLAQLGLRPSDSDNSFRTNPPVEQADAE